jgi:hypothetical protein
MIGVTVFGLIFTPIFYVVVRKFVPAPRSHSSEHPTPAE